jgi:hypothetical protein
MKSAPSYFHLNGMNSIQMSVDWNSGHLQVNRDDKLYIMNEFNRENLIADGLTSYTITF